MAEHNLVNNHIEMALLDTISDLIRVVDENNQVVYYNHAMRLALEDQMYHVYDTEDYGFFDFKMTARCLASGETIQRETYVGDVYYSVKTNPIRSSEGGIIGAIEVYRDKGVEKRLQIELVEKNRSFTEEQVSASAIQRSLLPPKGFMRALCMDYYFRPAELLSGDFFDVMQIDDDHVVFYIADAVGHGFSSSMTTVFISQTMRNMAPELLVDPTVAMLELVHRFRELNLPDTMYFTMFLGVYSLKNRKLTYVNAGHDCPPLIKREGNVRLLLNAGFPVTPLVEASFYECRSEYIQRGDEILLYTDGMTECRSRSGEQFGVEGLRKLFREVGEEPLSHIIDRLREFVQSEIVDDMTCLYLKIL